MQVLLETSLGTIKIELDAAAAPATVQNFIQYVESGFYDGTIFHRVIKGFMVQGGGMLENMDQKPTKAPIKNEAKTGLLNKKGTIAMARTSDPHSATGQFFINLVDNAFLDFKAENVQGWGYCAFGTVVEGMDVVEAMGKVRTTSREGHQDVPFDPVVLTHARVFETTV